MTDRQHILRIQRCLNRLAIARRLVKEAEDDLKRAVKSAMTPATEAKKAS